MISTITVVSTVSRREGQLTLAVSLRTCRTNSPGETFAILFGRPVCAQSKNTTNRPRPASPSGDRRLDLTRRPGPIRPVLPPPQDRPRGNLQEWRAANPQPPVFAADALLTEVHSQDHGRRQ